MAVSLSSCKLFDYIEQSFISKSVGDKESKGSYTEISKPSFTFSEYYTPSISEYSYKALTNDYEKKLYDGLRESCFFVSPNKDTEGYKTKQVVIEDYLLSEAEVRIVIKAFMDDNPECFWLSSSFGYWKYDALNYTAVQVYSYLSPSEITKMQNSFVEISNELFSSIKSGLNEYEREKYVHDYLREICTYDNDEAKTNEITNYEAYNVYGALVKNLAVCEGYSRTFEFLLSSLGVDTVCIMGSGEEQLHMWNCVLLGGDWYYVDVTWDDMENEYSVYNYLNISEEQLLDDHTIANTFDKFSEEEICGNEGKNAAIINMFVPKCDSIAYNYFVRECAHLKDFDGADVVDSLYEYAKAQKEYFRFYIDPEYLEFDSAVDSLFSSYPQYFFSYIQSVNSRLTEFSIDEENVSYGADSVRHSVTVELNYF